MMKNKPKLKKFFAWVTIFLIIFIGIIILINTLEYQKLNQNYNYTIGKIISKVREKYPSVTENDIMEIINNDKIDADFFAKYSISFTDSIIIQNNQIYKNFLIFKIIIYLLLIFLIFLIFLHYHYNRNKELKKIIRYLEKINEKNYALEINELSEDELSILKNELYKITVQLRESADNSLKDKIELKKSLEDISHQLKTPLTSILIMLDNLEDNDLDEDLREEFLRDIKSNVININFLVQNILKLSKFDANTIKFKQSEFFLKELIDASIFNVSTLCDLKNIKIKTDIDTNIKVKLDYHWQVEAITNILKNCIEYSINDSQIFINAKENIAYVKITITDFGKGINKEDLPHIFERFYKGTNSSNDSVGIGLSLAKTIIEKDNGNINVESNNKGTTFEIRYYKL